MTGELVTIHLEGAKFTGYIVTEDEESIEIETSKNRTKVFPLSDVTITPKYQKISKRKKPSWWRKK